MGRAVDLHLALVAIDRVKPIDVLAAGGIGKIEADLNQQIRMDGGRLLLGERRTPRRNKNYGNAQYGPANRSLVHGMLLHSNVLEAFGRASSIIGRETSPESEASNFVLRKTNAGKALRSLATKNMLPSRSAGFPCHLA